MTIKSWLSPVRATAWGSGGAAVLAEGAIVVLADWAKEAVDKVAASLPKGRAMAVHIDVSDHVAVEK